MEEKKYHSYLDNPEEYLRTSFAEANKRQEKLKAINIENHQFYEGIDSELEKRKNDKNVKRSAVFIQEIKPAIDTRVANIIAKVEEREFPLIVRPKDKDASPEKKFKASLITQNLSEQMRDINYLSEIFQEHILAAELYRSPSTVKVGWEQDWEKEAFVVEPKEGLNDQNFLQKLFGNVQNSFSSKPKVEYRRKNVKGKPYVRYISPDEFLYEPNVSRFHDDSKYVLETMYLDYERLMIMAEEEEWDMDLLRLHADELRTAGKSINASGPQRIAEEAASQRHEGTDGSYRDGRILIVEAFVVTFVNGEKVYYRAVMVANKYLVYQQKSPLILFGFPYVPIMSNRMPGGIESLSSVDVVKWMQRLYNETFNTWLDAISYRTFPPFKCSINNGFKGNPIWEPGALWRLSDPKDLEPVIPPGSHPAPDLVPVMNAIANAIRNVLDVPDLAQGFTAQAQEKATIGKIRFAAAQRRAIPTSKDYGDALVMVADRVLKLNQQYAPDKENWILNGGHLIDAPTLTTVTDPEGDIQKTLLIYKLATDSILYANPTGKLKLRNILADIVSKIRPHDVDDFVPSVENVETILGAELETQLAQSEQESIMKQQLLNSGGTQPVQPQNQGV